MDTKYFELEFDWKFYILQNIDLEKAGINNKDKAWNHLNKYGWKEHRNMFKDPQIMQLFKTYKNTGIICPIKVYYENNNTSNSNFNDKFYNVNYKIIIYDVSIINDIKKYYLNLNLYFYFKSNNINYYYQIHENPPFLYGVSNYNSIYSLGVPFSNKLKLQYPIFNSAEIYNNNPIFNLMINNISSTFLNNNYTKKFCAPLDNNIINIINLKSREDRWNKINTIKLQHFKFKRYDAIKARAGWGWEGCAMSHVNLVKYAKKNNLKYIIVAEDDFINTIHIENWELRLTTIINWLMKNDDKWDIFNGLPAGVNVDKAINILNKDIGLVNLNGGYNTHFIIYNHTIYDTIIKWYDFYDPNNMNEKRNHLLAMDVYLSNNTNMITAFPLLTNSNNDDSDIIGTHTSINNNMIEQKKQELIICKKRLDDNNSFLSQKEAQILTDTNHLNNCIKDKIPIENINKIKQQITIIEKELQEIKNPDILKKQIEKIQLELNNYTSVDNLNKHQSESHFKNNSQVLCHFSDSLRFFKHTSKLFANKNFDINSDVTVVITSYNRWSQLYKTIKSFYKYNTYPIKNIIIIEDSGKIRMKNNIEKYFPEIKLIFDGKSKGQINRIYEVWSHVDTNYIFHMEDDWLFLESFFIEQSKILLENNDKLLNVWLRDLNDTNLHPIEYNIHQTKGIFYWLLELNYDNDWHGFTWNPVLYKKNFIYNELLKNKDKIDNNTNALLPEIIFSNHFKNLNLRSAIIPGGYTIHIGEISSAVPENNDLFKI